MCLSPTSTVAATAADFAVSRRKNQTLKWPKSGSKNQPSEPLGDRPLPLPSGGEGQRKKFGMSSARLKEIGSGVPKICDKYGSHQSGKVEQYIEDFSKHGYQNLTTSSSDDLHRKKISPTKSSSAEKKLLATSKIPANVKPSSVLIPLSQQIQKPVWQFSSPTE